jgi:hypothetical protein
MLSQMSHSIKESNEISEHGEPAAWLQSLRNNQFLKFQTLGKPPTIWGEFIEYTSNY